MKTNKELFNERLARVKKAIALEKPDRTPVVLMADSFCARHLGLTIADYCKSFKVANEIQVESAKRLGDFEGTTYPFCTPILFSLAFMTKVKTPGIELPPDSLWQIEEKEIMSRADYDTILKKGWATFSKEYLIERINFPWDAVMDELQCAPQCNKNFEDAGYIVYTPIIIVNVTEWLSFGRSFAPFVSDIYQIPDKVEAVLDVLQAERLEGLRQMVRASKPLAVFIQPGRGSGEFFRPKLWERFVWKYLKETAEMLIQEGTIVDFHLDGNWETNLEYFKCFPKGSCVIEVDGKTNLYKVKEKLGDRFCMKGDVPASLLTLGTPEDVYNYSAKLIKDLGPGFILSSGCTTPPDAKVNNVAAMIAAGKGEREKVEAMMAAARES